MQCEDIEGTVEKLPLTQNSSSGGEYVRFSSVSVSVEGGSGESCAHSSAGNAVCEGVCGDE